MKTKLQVKSNSNLTDLCGIHFKNIQYTTIKKGTVKVVYVEDKKLKVFSRCISVEHSFLNNLLIFATCIKTSGLVAYNVKKASPNFDLSYFSKENQQIFN